MNALVTGAGGFLGFHIAKQLVARGDRVRSFCRGSYSRLDALGVETIRGDLRDLEATAAACRGVDVVFHAAAKAGIAGGWKSFYESNTLGTRHVVEGCLRHGVGRLVYTSTPSVVFDGTDLKGVDESAPYSRRFLAPYPRSKAQAEQHVLGMNGSEGLATCALRPHLIWGPGDRHLIPRLLRRARSGRLRRVGSGANRIDTIYIDNAATAHLQAAEALSPQSPVAGRAYFISQDEPVVCWDWIDAILGLAGLPPVEKSISLQAAWRVGFFLEMGYRLFRPNAEPPMTRFLAAQLARSHFFDIGRAREDFGYEPIISTAEGMKRLAAELAADGEG